MKFAQSDVKLNRNEPVVDRDFYTRMCFPAAARYALKQWMAIKDYANSEPDITEVARSIFRLTYAFDFGG